MKRYDASAHESYGILSENVALMTGKVKKIEALLKGHFSTVIENDPQEQKVHLEAMVSEGERLELIVRRLLEDAYNAACSIGMVSNEQIGMFDPETGEAAE